MCDQLLAPPCTGWHQTYNVPGLTHTVSKHDHPFDASSLFIVRTKLDPLSRDQRDL